MPLSLQLTVPRASVTTLDGLKAIVELRNDTPQALQLPGPADATDALTLEARNARGQLVQQFNGLIQQEMMSSGRIDAQPLLEPLAPGASFRWEIDLAAYHYPLPAGQYTLSAGYRFDPASATAQSAGVPVTVSEVRAGKVDVVRDNPVLDGLFLLIAAEGTPGRCWLRQHIQGRPLACWYSEPAEFDGAGDVFASSPNFFSPDTFDHFFKRWILWTRGGKLLAQLHASGKGTGPVIEAPLPAGRKRLRSAFHTLTGELFMFMEAPGSLLELYDVNPGSLTRIFQTPMPPAPIRSIRADAHSVHVVSAAQRLTYERLSLAGAPAERRELFGAQLAPYFCEYDPERKLINAIYRDAEGKMIRLVSADATGGAVAECEFEEETIGGGLREISFDVDRRGRFHILAANSGRRLVYYTPDREPRAVARNEDHFFPRVVVTASSLYLGHYTTHAGYRFVQITARRPAPRPVEGSA